VTDSTDEGDGSGLVTNVGTNWLVPWCHQGARRAATQHVMRVVHKCC
jgi:hypothetical protein